MLSMSVACVCVCTWSVCGRLWCLCVWYSVHVLQCMCVWSRCVHVFAHVICVEWYVCVCVCVCVCGVELYVGKGLKFILFA